MTLATDEFIRRFLIHVLPHGFHRIRHYGLFASGTRADNIARARELLAVAKPEGQPTAAAADPSKPTCPCCGGRMIIIEVFERGATPRHRPTGSNDRHQDRHLMTASQSRKSARRARCLSTGHGRARSDIQPVVANRPPIHRVRRHPPLMHEPLHRRPTCWIGSTPITHLIRGTQIPIAPAARPYVPPARFPPLEVCGRRPRARGATVMGPASETLHISGLSNRLWTAITRFGYSFVELTLVACGRFTQPRCRIFQKTAYL